LGPLKPKPKVRTKVPAPKVPQDTRSPDAAGSAAASAAGSEGAAAAGATASEKGSAGAASSFDRNRAPAAPPSTRPVFNFGQFGADSGRTAEPSKELLLVEDVFSKHVGDPKTNLGQDPNEVTRILRAWTVVLGREAAESPSPLPQCWISALKSAATFLLSHLSQSDDPAPIWPEAQSLELVEGDATRSLGLWIQVHVEYGCALLLRAIPPRGVWNVTVLGLDRWEYAMAYDEKTRVPFATCPPQPAILACGELPAGREESFHGHFQELLRVAAARTAHDRHSVTGKGRGHQKTPTFISAVAFDAIRCAVAEQGISENEETQVQGGTTDVGQHTGAVARMTAWPLACSLLLHISVNEFAPLNSAWFSILGDTLVAESDVMNVAIACFACRAAEVKSLSREHTAGTVDAIMGALQTATRHIVEAPTAEFGLKSLSRRVTAARRRADELGRTLDRTGFLPELPIQGPGAENMQQMISRCVSLHEDLLPKPTPGQRRSQTARVSETLQLVANGDGSVGDFCSWWQSLSVRDNTATDLLRLRAADKFMTKKSKVFKALESVPATYRTRI
jgi:hypothetical protein